MTYTQRSCIVDEIPYLPVLPELRREWPFMINGHNDVYSAAKTLADWMYRQSSPAFFYWNGTPFDGFPGDTDETILNRWRETRDLWALAMDHGWKDSWAPKHRNAVS